MDYSYVHEYDLFMARYMALWRLKTAELVRQNSDFGANSTSKVRTDGLCCVGACLTDWTAFLFVL